MFLQIFLVEGKLKGSGVSWNQDTALRGAGFFIASWPNTQIDFLTLSRQSLASPFRFSEYDFKFDRSFLVWWYTRKYGQDFQFSNYILMIKNLLNKFFFVIIQSGIKLNH